MAKYNQDWEDLGRDIQNIVDQAVNSHDYQKLNKTIRQTVDRAVNVGGEAVRRVVDSTVILDRAVSHGQSVKNLYGKTIWKTIIAILKTIYGGLFSFSSFVLVVGMTYVTFTDISNLGTLGFMLLLLAGSLWLAYSGVKTLGMVTRFKTYRRVLGNKTHCSLEKLARSVRKTEGFVRKELWLMINKGYFLEGHMDKEETCLITSDETYRLFEQSRLQLEERQRQEAAAKKQKAAVHADPQVQEILDRGNAFIAEIRRCNDAIPGEEISAKIDRMENLVRRIFRRAEEHPEIVPDLKKMMDYYLPMTVKLLNAYADMDAQPIQGETIESSKREIELTLDTLNLAFEKLLDDLFKDTALDVSSDISVLQTLLAQEGLTEDEFTKMKNKQNA